MVDSVQDRIGELKSYLRDIEYLNSAIGVLGWDMRTNIPRKGVEYRAEVLGYLSTEHYRKITNKKIGEYIEYFSGKEEELGTVDRAMISNLKKEYERIKKIPEDRYREYAVLQSIAGEKWEEAKTKSDFSIFAPYLEKVINFTKEFIDYWGYEDKKYDTLLDMYEPGMTTRDIDRVFGELKNALIDLLNRIKSSGVNIDIDFLNGNYPPDVQRKLGIRVAKFIGYDFEKGRLDESMHPFTTEFCNRDVRITTNFDESNILPSLFSCIHEGGHGIYEQNIPDDLYGTLLAHGVSMGIHESQSRLYENIIGRSFGFLKAFYPEIIKLYPKFKDVSLENFYRAVNRVEPSLIRTDADELTYSLHIIIRYEIEKMIIDGDVKVEELPGLWNEKYKEYLGIVPKNDSEGVLQDMHWSDGSFGYFPSYALGNLYGAQFFNRMKEDILEIKDNIGEGELKKIKEWLKENIHKYGSVYKPKELLSMATGKELSAGPFITYLNDKYGKIYNL